MTAGAADEDDDDGEAWKRTAPELADVRCVECWEDYQTPVVRFQRQKNKCPRCGAWKAQRTDAR